MICPNCENPMIVVEHKRIELDYCPNCEGVWFDSGELELLLESAGLENQKSFLDNILAAAEIRTTEKKRKCPICARKMNKTIIDKDSGILVDVCQQEDGLWFDGGELSQLVKHMASQSSHEPGAQKQVIDFIADVFKAPE